MSSFLFLVDLPTSPWLNVQFLFDLSIYPMSDVCLISQQLVVREQMAGLPVLSINIGQPVEKACARSVLTLAAALTFGLT